MTRRNWREALVQLRKDGRMTLTALSRKTGIPVSSLFDHLKRLKKDLRFTLLLDFERMRNTRAFVVIRCKKGQRDECLNRIRKNACVNNLFRINNGFDFLVEVVVSDLKELEDWLTAQQGTVRKVLVFYVLEQLGQEQFFTQEWLSAAPPSVRDLSCAAPLPRLSTRFP